MTRHVLEIDDLSHGDIKHVLDLAEDLDRPPVLRGRTVGLYFEKPSLRTRHSSETAVVELGGHPVTFRKDEIGGSSREPMSDIARVLSGYHAALGARVFDHRILQQLASVATIPIVNLLSDEAHPCQTLADLLTMRQEWGSLEGRSVAWIGDFNNVGSQPLPRHRSLWHATSDRQPERLWPHRGRHRPDGGGGPRRRTRDLRSTLRGGEGSRRRAH